MACLTPEAVKRPHWLHVLAFIIHHNSLHHFLIMLLPLRGLDECFKTF